MTEQFNYFITQVEFYSTRDVESQENNSGYCCMQENEHRILLYTGEMNTRYGWRMRAMLRITNVREGMECLAGRSKEKYIRVRNMTIYNQNERQ